MNPQKQFCPNVACHASERIGGDNIVIHSQKRQRYKCTCCQSTFSARKGTGFYRLKKAESLFALVVILLAYGCPVQAIVAAYALDERTVRSWLLRAGAQAQRVHEGIVQNAKLDLVQVQADEIRIKTQGGIVWMALALMVSTRLWLAGAVSRQRDMKLSQRLATQVRRMALERPLLVAVDGWKSYIRAFRSAFRTRQPNANGKRGRPHLVAWCDLVITQVIKRRTPVWSLERRIVQGSEAMVTLLLHHSQVTGTINTAYIERLNATVRQRLSCLARRTRALPRRLVTVEAVMFLMGGVYNFCTPHQTLEQTPAMAAQLTDHCWTVDELMRYKIPTHYQPIRRRGRPRKFTCACGFHT